MKRIGIIGGGFAGMAAARELSGKKVEVHLFDPKSTFDFLPLLPDVLGKRYSADSVSRAYRDSADRFGFLFHEEQISEIDPENLTIETEDGTKKYNYDYLIVATGAVTNFYGDSDAAENSLRIRRLNHVKEILYSLENDRPETVLVVGGGYTGLETASQLHRFRKKQHHDLKIIVLDLNDSIFSKRPQWMKTYMEKQMKDLGVTIKTGCTIDSFIEQGVRLTSGEEVIDCAVIWTAGIQITNPFLSREVTTDKKGQIIVDRYLRIEDRCYVVGDISRVEKNGEPLPLASYFSVQQGRSAAHNILRNIKEKRMRPYRPLDYGLIIPLANGRGCGKFLGFKVKGPPAALIHHISSYFRTFNKDTRRSIRRDLFSEGIGL